MRKIELVSRRRMTRSELQDRFEVWAAQQNAIVKPMGRLVRQYKSEGENMHWHITGLQRKMGTVEITYAPSFRLLTVLVHDNRQGTWAGHACETLARQLNKHVGKSSR